MRLGNRGSGWCRATFSEELGHDELVTTGTPRPANGAARGFAFDNEDGQ